MRYISFTFDDCYLESCNKANDILLPYKATFYLTSGWIKPNNCEIKDESNKNINHGCIEDWKKLFELGHELGAHTHTHIRMTDKNCYSECLQSLELIKQIQTEGPYSFATPYFDNVSHVMINMFDSIRVGYKNSRFYNNLEKLDWKLLTSFCPLAEGRNFNKVLEIIKNTPDNHWVILCLHGLDKEGFSPISSEELKRLREFSLQEKIDIKNIKEVYMKAKL